MLFAHAPKLVLTGSYAALRGVADRASALDADVVVVCAGADLALDDVRGFDWAMLALDEATPKASQVEAALPALAGGLRRGALVIVAADGPVDDEARHVATELALRTGLDLGGSFAVVACRAGEISWGVDEQAVDEARYLVSRIGAPAASTA